MMKLRIAVLILSALSLLRLDALAQTEAEQMLIFRNTGEVNLLYSNEVDSIMLSTLDKDSVAHGEYVSQVFFMADSALVVPLEEIDSVAFGSRNVIEYKKGVVVIDDTHRSYMTQYDASGLRYSPNTPSDIKPCEGAILFYGEQDEMFPAGLAVRVKSVQGDLCVVEPVDLSDVFSRLFFAGTMQEELLPSENARNKARAPKLFPINTSVNVGDVATIGINAPVTISPRFVVHPLRHYYHAEFNIDGELETSITAHIKKAGITSEEFKTACLLDVPFPAVCAVLFPRVRVPVLVEFNAEMNGDLTQTRSFHLGWEWTRRNGENSFNRTTPTDEAKKPVQNKASLTLDGSLFVAPEFEFDLSVVNAAGIDAEIAVGPVFESHFGLGAVQTLATSDDESDRTDAWAQALLSVALRVSAKVNEYHPNLLAWGNRDENVVWGPFSHDFFKHEYDLLPRFTKVNSVGYPKKTADGAKTEVTAALKDEAELVAPVEVGIQVTKDKEPIDSVVVAPTPQTADQPVRAYVCDSLVVKEDIDRLELLPVVHYAEQTLRYVPVTVKHCGIIQPYFFSCGNGLATVTAGSTAIGQAKKDTTIYVLGNYIPAIKRDTMYVAYQPIPEPYFMATQDEVDALVGTWGDEETGNTLIILDSANGVLTTSGGEEKRFTYQLDNPQLGDIRFCFSESEYVVLTMTAYDTVNMVLYDKKGKKTYKLKRFF